MSDHLQSDNPIPVFAVVGHPNEGKSSVVSTLSEDDSVRITPEPGETLVCQSYPVRIDNKEIIRFVDTPGFQAPKKTLAWFKAYAGPEKQIVRAFRKAFLNSPDLQDEYELLGPIEQGSGIIYVVDGSRPIRSDDRAEMEILRMTGLPRMAVINSKDEAVEFIEDWKAEFRKHFNIVRVFNAHTATYKERIALLESLKVIDQDWQPALETVISAFQKDWHARNSYTAELIVEMLEHCITYKLSRNYADQKDTARARQKAQKDYSDHIHKFEKKIHRKIKKRFKHNIFNLDLPTESIVYEDLFDKRTWQLLGLNPKQLAITAGMAGGVFGSILDVAAGGLSFGVFTALSGLAGAGSVLVSGNKMVNIKIKGIKIGGFQIQIGPMANPQLMFVLIDRVLIFYANAINWAHGRQGLSHPRQQLFHETTTRQKKGYTAEWNESDRKLCLQFFNSARREAMSQDSNIREDFFKLIIKTLATISNR